MVETYQYTIMVLAWVIINPVLYDAQSAAPFTGVIESKSGIAGCALHSAVHGSIRRGFPHAILACTVICWEIKAAHVSAYSQCACGKAYKRERTMSPLLWYTKIHVRIQSVLAWLIVHPVLHDVHSAAPTRV